MDGLPGPANRAGGGVDFQVVAPQYGVFLLVPAANERPNAGEQFVHLERLGQVVVGPGVEPGHLVVSRGLGGEHQHVRVDPGPAPPLKKCQAVHLGEHDVEHDHVVRCASALDVRFFAVGRDIDGEPFLLQALPQCFQERLVIFNEQYAHGIALVAGDTHIDT